MNTPAKSLADTSPPSIFRRIFSLLLLPLFVAGLFLLSNSNNADAQTVTATSVQRYFKNFIQTVQIFRQLCEENTTGSGEITFHIDHTITGRYTSRIFPKYSIRGENCPTENYNMQETWDKHNVTAPHSGTFIGSWKIRQ